jgi:hypothetical protein
MKRLLLIAAAGVITVVGATAGALIAPATAGDGPLTPELQEVRQAVARYHSPEQALRAGYVFQEGEPCVTSPPDVSLDGSSGTMGVHAPNPALLGSPAIDPLRPELLLYVPKANGELEFVGVEYWAIALTSTGPWFGQSPPPGGFVTSPPSLFGQTFQGPMPGHTPEMPWHYDLHAWVAEANPAGVLAMFNPAISC